MVWRVLFYLYVIAAFSVPVFWIYKLIQSFFGKRGIFINKKFILNNEKVEVFYSFIVIALSSFNLLCISSLVDTGIPLERYELNGQYLNSYTPLSFQHILTFAVLFILGLLVYFILINFNGKMAPLLYVISCSILLINIALNVIYFTHTFKVNDWEFTSSYIIKALGRHLIYLSMMYVVLLKQSMDKVRSVEGEKNKIYKNVLVNKLYRIFLKYETNVGFWTLFIFPVL